jgi:hypothetical protein
MYAFRKGKRGSAVPQRRKTQTTAYVDNDVLLELRRRADAAGRGDLPLTNYLLRQYLGRAARPPDEEALRRTLTEELKATGWSWHVRSGDGSGPTTTGWSRRAARC